MYILGVAQVSGRWNLRQLLRPTEAVSCRALPVRRCPDLALLSPPWTSSKIKSSLLCVELLGEMPFTWLVFGLSSSDTEAYIAGGRRGP